MFRTLMVSYANIGSKINSNVSPVCLECSIARKRNYNANDQTRSISSKSYCMDLVKRRDYEHYLTTLLLPDKIRRMGFALRALNVEISSIRDNVSEEAIGKMRLQFWKDSINDIYNKKHLDDRQEPLKIPNHPVVIELHQCLLKHPNISLELLNRMISSREVFLSNHQPFQSMEEVSKYSENTFSSINNILLESLIDSQNGNELHGHAKHCANQLGKAEGIVTLLRALPYNASQNRVYLPLSLLVSHKISTESIIRGLGGDELRHVIEVIAAVAEENLENSRFRKKYLSVEEKRIMLTAVSVDSYLSKLAKVNCDVFDKFLQRKDSWLPFKLYTHKWKRSY